MKTPPIKFPRVRVLITVILFIIGTTAAIAILPAIERKNNFQHFQKLKEQNNLELSFDQFMLIHEWIVSIAHKNIGSRPNYGLMALIYDFNSSKIKSKYRLNKIKSFDYNENNNGIIIIYNSGMKLNILFHRGQWILSPSGQSSGI
jgi:hypothetical protein